MRAAWFVARTQLRRRWASVIVLTVIVGLTGAVVISSLAGARRTASSFERFRDDTLDPDLTIFAPTVDDDAIADLRAQPGVEGMAELRQLTGRLDGSFTGAIAGRFDRDFMRTVGGARVLDGRLPRQDRIEEVAVPEPLARSLGLEVGDTFRFEGFTQDQVDAILRGEEGADEVDPEGPSSQLRVVGIVRSPQDLSFQGTQGGVIVTTRAFTDRYADQIGSFSGTVLVVRATDDEASRRFVRAARAELGDVGAEGEFQVVPTSESRGAVQDSIDVVATGLIVFGLAAALAGLVVVAVVVRRFVDGGATDLVALQGLGVSRRGRALALALPLAPVAVLGAAMAVLAAWLASPIFPLGLARKAEPHLGLHADALVLALGFVACVGLVVVLGWAAARLTVRDATRERVRETRPAPLSTAVGASSPAVRVGVAAATSRSGATAPLLPAVAGTVVAVAGIIAVIVTASSLRHLERTPSVFGYNWDAHVVVDEANRIDPERDCSPAQVAVASDHAVAAAADTCSASIEVEGYSVTGTGFMPLVGDVGPTVLEGRAPRAPNEVALGTTTLSRVHRSIGDTVQIAGPTDTAKYHVVGRVALPTFPSVPGEGGDVQAIADGAVFTGDGLARIEESESDTSARVLVRWREGADVAAAKRRIAQLQPDPVTGRSQTHPLAAEPPLEVDRLQQIHPLLWLLGAFLVVIGVLGLGFGLVTSMRRRAREIAVLKTMGFRRSQVEMTVAVQATAYAVVGLVIGVPLGVIVGRATWDRIATSSGFAVRPIVSVVLAALVVVGALIIVNVVAWFPGRRAARVRPAVVLRGE